LTYRPISSVDRSLQNPLQYPRSDYVIRTL